MASKIIKLTPDMFESGNINRQDSDIGKTLAQCKQDWSVRIRSKELIPVMSKRTLYVSGSLGVGYTIVKSTVGSNGKTSTSIDGYLPFNLTPDWKHYWVKWTLADKIGTSPLKHALFRTTSQSGKSVYIAKPMLNFGDEIYPYSSAPEDESNPTEAI